jgi:hypothetical protein
LPYLLHDATKVKSFRRVSARHPEVQFAIGGSPGHRTPISLLKRQDFSQFKLATQKWCVA